MANGEPSCSESECDTASRRLAFMKMVGLGKAKRESASEPPAGGPEEREGVVEEEEEEPKPREPLSGRRDRACVCVCVFT